MKDHLGLFEITLAVNKVLKDNFPDVTRESDEVKEGFKLPSFFVQTVPLSFSHESEIYKKLKVLISIKYFSKSGKEIENIKMADDLARVFGITLRVKGQKEKDRILKLYGINSYTDSEGTLSFDFNLDFTTFLDRVEEDRELMGDVDIEQIKE